MFRYQKGTGVGDQATQRSNLLNALVFTGYVLLLSFYFYKNTITLFPSYIHAWTQSDRYALALGFLENGFDFFHPRTMNLATPEGITRVDFPIHEYMVAGIMQLLQTKDPAVFRLYTLLYSIAGLIFLYRLSLELTASALLSHLMVVFVFTVPCYTYYQDGFLPTVPSVANSFIAYYFYFRYLRSSSFRYFAVSIFFFTLAALARTPFAIFLIAVFCQRLLVWIDDKELSVKEALAQATGFAATAGYFMYNEQLGRKYGSAFLTRPLPPGSLTDFFDILNMVYDKWITEYFSVFHYLLIAAGLFFFAAYFLKERTLPPFQRQLVLQIFTGLTGASLYAILMAQQYIHHEYYFLDSFFVPLVLLAVFLLAFAPRLSLNVALPVVGILGCGFIWKSTETQTFKYTLHSWNGQEMTRRNFEGSDRFLDSVNIPANSRMLVIDAYCTNLPLLLMKRKGYTLINIRKQAEIDSCLRLKHDFIVIQDQFLVPEVLSLYPELIHRLKKVAGNGKITLYKLRPYEVPTDIHAFIGIDKGSAIGYSLSFESDTASAFCHYTGNVSDSVAATGLRCAYFDKDIEFGTGFRIAPVPDTITREGKVLVEGTFLPAGPLQDVHVVLSIERDKTKYYYHSFPLMKSLRPEGRWQRASFLFQLPHTHEGDEMSVYLWNQGRAKFFYDDLSLLFYDHR